MKRMVLLPDIGMETVRRKRVATLTLLLTCLACLVATLAGGMRSSAAEAGMQLADGGTATEYNDVGERLDYRDILGNARYYGIVTDDWYQSEAETNAAVKRLYATNQSGNDMTAAVADSTDVQPWAIGSIGTYSTSSWPVRIATSDTLPMSFIVKGRPSSVWAPSCVTAVLHHNATMDVHECDTEMVNAYVDAMTVRAFARSAEFAKADSVIGDLPEPSTASSTETRDRMTTNYVIDVTPYETGTYFVDVTDVYQKLNEGGLRLRMRGDQTVVVNHLGTGTVSLRKAIVTIDGHDFDTASANAGTEPMATHVVWNVPNADSVSIDGGITGMILAPKARVDVNATSAGWLIARAVYNGSGEWHNVWQSYDQSYKVPGDTFGGAENDVVNENVDNGNDAVDENRGNTVNQEYVQEKPQEPTGNDNGTSVPKNDDDDSQNATNETTSNRNDATNDNGGTVTTRYEETGDDQNTANANDNGSSNDNVTNQNDGSVNDNDESGNTNDNDSSDGDNEDTSGQNGNGESLTHSLKTVMQTGDVMARMLGIGMIAVVFIAVGMVVVRRIRH